MYRAFIAFLVSLTLFAPLVHAQDEGSISVELPEAVELAMIVAALSELDRGGQSINRESRYAEAVEAHFAPHMEHAIFDALGDQFNLPRLAGNAADFVFGDAGNLIERDTSGSIWGDAQGDLFRRHLALLEDFAAESEFLAFYRNQRPTYAAGISAVSDGTDGAAMTQWLEANFTARPGPMQIIVSPLVGNLNWTTLFKPQTRMWVAPPSNVRPTAELSDYDRVREAYSVFTELDHSYVNPATSRILDQVEPAFQDLTIWTRPGSSAAIYSTAELQFNEYMTWTVYLMYAFDQLPQESFQLLREEFVSFMVEQRGFIAFESFADAALERYADGEVTAEDVMPFIAAWAHGYAPAGQKVGVAE